MKKLLKVNLIIAIVVLFTIGSTLVAYSDDPVWGGAVSIVDLTSYSDGRFFIKTDPRNTTDCNAGSADFYGDFFLSPGTDGFKEKVSMLMTAHLTDRKIQLRYQRNDNGYCQVYSVKMF